MANSEILDIDGVTIEFPYSAYDIQKDYMRKVIECLRLGKNGVLESPTGTGKTLSLLCSSLAWLSTDKARRQLEERGYTGGDIFLDHLKQKLDSVSSSSWGNLNQRCKIVYSSRTHAQLNQVMLELKKTSYRQSKVGVLGSREQLCIHPVVSKETNLIAKVNMCKSLVSRGACSYYRGVETNVSDDLFTKEILVDIEDLIIKSSKKGCCPYYLSKQLQNDVDILFAPYNYLLDPKTRKAHDIKLQGAVVILDEGHNVEKVCEEATSSKLSSTLIALCIKEMSSFMQIYHSEMERDLTEGNVNAIEISEDNLCWLQEVLLKLESSIDAIALNGENKSATFLGSYIFRILADATVGREKITSLIEILFKVSQYLLTLNDAQTHNAGTSLSKFQDFLEVVDNTLGGNEKSTATADACYKLYVEEEVIKPVKGNFWSAVKMENVQKSSPGKVLHFWCFSPGFGMKSMQEQGVRSIILTSGTLSPISATISEIAIPIDVQLTNPHIIQSNQICSLVVEKGPANNELRCVYQNRSNKNYLSDLGQSLLNLFRLMPGGVLTFFPSYFFMKSCVEFWQESGLWGRLKACKEIFVEPQTKESLKTVIEEYYKTIAEKNAASIFAVCRGKISEGMDFSDSKARAVIVIGLPYPPYNDARVSLKREHLNNEKRNKKSLLDGSEWYQLEAMRAVNQAVGRVIRHKNDHGAIIFLDCRFSYHSNKESLSKWLQDYIEKPRSFGEVVKTVNTFFRFWKDYDAPKMSSQNSTIGSSFNRSETIATRQLKPAQSLAREITAEHLSHLYDCKSEVIDNKRDKISHDNEISRKCNAISHKSSVLSQLDNFADGYNSSENLFDRLKNVTDAENGELPTRKNALVSPVSQPAVKRKKLIIRPNPTNGEQKHVDSKRDDSNAEINIKNECLFGGENLKSEIIKYTEELQKILSSEDLTRFIRALQDLQSSKDSKKFVQVMSSLFLEGQNKLTHLYDKAVIVANSVAK